MAAVHQCADLLGGLGHKVQTDDPRYPLWATPAMVAAWFACPAGDAPGPGVEPRTRRHVRAGRAVLRVRPPGPGDGERLRAAFGPFFERHDVLLMPTLARPCPPARRWGERSWLHSVITSLTFAPMTGVWNMTGYPAASVPTPAAAGRPGSVQLVAGPGGESVLLALAAQIERARGWRRHAPAYDPSG